jgi:hypothetical protein
MDEDRLEVMIRKLRAGEISEEEWVDSTTPWERMVAVMRYDEPSDEEILTMEQMAIAMEISNRVTAPDEVDQIDPENIDGPEDLTPSNNGGESE